MAMEPLARMACDDGLMASTVLDAACPAARGGGLAKGDEPKRRRFSSDSAMSDASFLAAATADILMPMDDLSAGTSPGLSAEGDKASGDQPAGQCVENATCGGSTSVMGVHMPPGGWFAKCRGCGWMTAHEMRVADSCMPLCKRCEATLILAPPLLKAQMAASLSYVHTSWSNANL